MRHSIQITYPFFSNIRNLFLLTLFGFIVYYLVGFGFNAGALDLGSLNVWQLTAYLLIDQYLIECFSVGILFGSVILYARIFSLNRVSNTVRGLTYYFLSFIPLALLVFFVINPVTQTLRFLWRFVGDPDWTIYREYYLLDPRLYLTYTGILLPLLFLGLGINLIMEIKRQEEETASGPKSEKWQSIKVFTDGHDTYLSTRDILWFEVRDRSYFAITAGGDCRITQTLSELETILNEHRFSRISRSTIINLTHVMGFSHWKNGKYIVKMDDTDQTEHTVPRNRVNDFKEKIASLHGKTGRHNRTQV